MLVDAADAVPAPPLHQSADTVDVDSLLAIPVQRPGVPFEFLQGAELIPCGQHETP